MVFYKVEFFYPDGHVEEFEDYYRSLEAAVKFGDDMLNQVAVTEQYHKRKDSPIKPYFLVTKIDGDNHSVVFNSKKQ